MLVEDSKRRRASLDGLAIAHVVISDKQWGAVRVATSLAKCQARKSRVWIAMNEDLLKTIRMPAGVRPFPLPIRRESGGRASVSNLRGLISSSTSAGIIESAYYSETWDIVHFHLPNAYLLSVLARKRMNRFFTIHGRLFENRALRLAERRLAGLAIGRSPVTAISQNATRFAPRISNVTVIPNGIDVDEVRGLSLSNPDVAPRSSQGSRPLLVFPANLVRRKGQDLLIESMDELTKIFPRVAALLVGDGPDAPFLENLASERGRGRVEFIGYTANPYPYMKMGDVILSHLSLRWPFPSLVELEALALGKPVITRLTDERLALYGDSVYYLRSEDPASLAMLVKQAFSEAGNELLAEKRRERAGRLSWESIAERYASLYAGCIR